jgi:MOSC domain-containing protein YiiM
MQSELFDEFMQIEPDGKKYIVHPGHLGENITTRGLDLLGLSEGTRLHFINSEEQDREGEHAVVRITGLRNPCSQINKFQKGLQERCIVRDENRKIVVRKAGVMGVVEVGGVIKSGATILVKAPTVFKEMGQV